MGEFWQKFQNIVKFCQISPLDFSVTFVQHLKGTLDPSYFIHCSKFILEIIVEKSQIRPIATLTLNDEFLDRFQIDSR